jgi:hypothetical protein
MNMYTQNIKINRPPDPTLRSQIDPRAYRGPFTQRSFNVPEPGMPVENPKFYAPQGLNTNPEPQKKSSYLPYLIVFLVILVIVALALVYALRDKIFKKGTTLGSAPPAEQADAGYGTYGPTTLGLCKTLTGLCSDPGSQTVTQQCIPNPITNLGCLDKDGNQTFAPKVSNQNCNIPCRQYKFIETTRNPSLNNNDLGTYDSICKYYPTGQTENGVIQPNYNDVVNYPCLPSNVKIGQYFVKRNTCLPNDKIGTNECSTTCGEIDFLPNGFTIPPTEDPNSVLYVPVCDPIINSDYKKPLKSRHFYLNTFPWEIAFSLPQNGVKIGKGFTIKNIIDSNTGNINQTEFDISPAYTSPYDRITGLLITDDTLLIPLNIITVEQLLDLDSNLYTYQSCEIANPRPLCGRYYLYNRTQFTPNVGVNETTRATLAFLDPPITSFRNLNNGQYYASRNCYFNDYNNASDQFETGYDFTYTPPTSTSLPYYTAGYSGYGIGSFGYINDEMTCLTSITIPNQESSEQTGAYNVPPSNGLCIVPTPIKTLIPPYPVASVELINTKCFPFDSTSTNPNLEYLPRYLPYEIDYPPTSGIFNTCNTQIAYQAAPAGGPGVLSVCRYMPNNEDIIAPTLNTDPLYNLPTPLSQLLGYYIRMSVTDSSSTPSSSYYLSLQSTPCDCTVGSTDDYNVPNCAANVGSNVILDEPLGNCNGNPNNFGVGPIPTMLIYNGTTNDDKSGGSYWERPGCDSLLMDAVNSLQLIISPRKYDSVNDWLECDILCVFMGSYNGYLSYDYNSSSPTYTQLVYVPVKPGDINPTDYKYYNGGTTTPFPLSTQGKFAIKNVTNTIVGFPKIATYDIKAYDTTAGTYTLDVSVPTFNGTAPPVILPFTSNFLNLNSAGNVTITLYEINGDPTTDPSTTVFNNSNLVPFNPYYIPDGTTGKYKQEPIVISETNGLYPGQNLASIVASQQTTACSAGTQTCNLFCSY